jgi:hypothetical protein
LRGTIHAPQSFNGYTYAANDPVNFVDPTGLDPCIDGEGRPVDCGPPVDPKDIIRTYTLAPSLSPFYIPASISGGSDILIALIPRKTLSAVLIETPNTVTQPTPKPGKGYWARFLECLNDNRLDNVIRDIGQSTGHPDIGDFAADLTVTGTIAAIANQGLNLTSLGKYPRQGIGGPAGSPTTWQHTVSGRIGRALEMPSIGRVGRLVGRGASRAAAVLLAFEAGYEVGTVMACAAIAY